MDQDLGADAAVVLMSCLESTIPSRRPPWSTMDFCGVYGAALHAARLALGGGGEMAGSPVKMAGRELLLQAKMAGNWIFRRRQIWREN